MRARPDLVEPLPPESFDELAERAGSISSLARCVRSVDTFLARLTEIVAVAEIGQGRFALGDLAGPTVPSVDLDDGLDRLRALALVFDDERSGVRLPGRLRRRLARPAGLGPPVRVLLARRSRGHLLDVARQWEPEIDAAAAAPDLVAVIASYLEDSDRWRESLSSGPPGVDQVLCTMSQRLVPTSEPGGAPDDALSWLVGRGLLIGEQRGVPEVPLEVGLAVRDGVVFADLACRPPELETAPLPELLLDSGAAQAGLALVGGLGAVLRALAREPAPLLKAGGLGVKSLRRLARSADLDDRTAAAVVELAALCALVAVDRDRGIVAPTALADVWLDLHPAQQWVLIVDRWWDGDRELDAPRPLTGPVLCPDAADQRKRHLCTLLEVPPGRRVTGGLAMRLGWEAPAIWRDESRTVADTVDVVVFESELFGLTMSGAITKAGRAVQSGDRAAIEEWASSALSVSSSLILQSDLTAIAGGHLDTATAEVLETVADIESRGGAVTYRFSRASVARGRTAGLGRSELEPFLTERSGQPLPASLDRLLADVDRLAGAVRVRRDGTVRTDDPILRLELEREPAVSAQLEPAPSHPSATSRRTQEYPAVLDTLRRLGHVPVLELDDGSLVAEGAPQVRLPAPVRGVPELVWHRSAAPERADIERIVALLRAGPPPSPPIGTSVMTPRSPEVAP